MSLNNVEPEKEPLQSSPLSEEEEPLQTISETAGWSTPEPEISISAEDEAAAEIAATPYGKWKLESNTDNLWECVNSLKPTIDSVLATNGAAGNPQIAAQARVIAAKAIQSYDPTQGASLATWVTQQLRALSRNIRQTDNIAGVPDKMILDQYAIYRAERELEDELGKEPTLQEIADRTHMSIKRITAINRKTRAVSHEGAYQDGANEYIQGGETDFSQDAMDYVYADSDRIDRKLMEYILGYGGKKPLSNQQIMEKLQLTPVQLTRRKQRIAERMKYIIENLEDVQ